jgi:hypothetical protein
MAASIRSILQAVLPSEIDESTLDYFESILTDMNSENKNHFDPATLNETLAPFLESYGLAEDSTEAEVHTCFSLSFL